ncbi:hypothetical protein POM88_033800 [Heracleum sosnowskyi]|uniref:RNase H type-1 domain-containing protein n=1 Tax=Heracleum sosnowskyi TaxID=360622 RepID=A0AAD8HJZ9_9APIA|nr:hypothetical protein POM88_033800 [Heracleum sosnowskyi]
MTLSGTAGQLDTNQMISTPSGNLIMHSDAHVLAGTGVGLGVIRDVHGHIIAAAVQKLQVKWKAEQAEAADVRFGLHLARSGIEGYSTITLLYEDITRMKSENCDT